MVFLCCIVNFNLFVCFIWKWGFDILFYSQDNGVDIYEFFYIQGEIKVLKLKNLWFQDYVSYICQVFVCNVCGILDKVIIFWFINIMVLLVLKLFVNEILVVNFGENVMVQCLLIGGDFFFQLQWFYGFGLLFLGVLVQGGIFSIFLVQVWDFGYYNCIVINNVGNFVKKIVNLLV